jgi:outer membrane protein OmpA-like peptidoglycan-associated protein
MRALDVKVPFSIVAALLVGGCAGGAVHLEQPVGETHTNSSSTGEARPQGVDTPFGDIGIVVHRDVRGPCGLGAESREPPRYDVQSGRLKAHGEDLLKEIAACFQSGKLGDVALTLVGHTDARGTPEYSGQLGEYRAIAAKDYLVALGVPGPKLSVESDGARDSRGTDAPSWALDRRVEVRISGGPKTEPPPVR